MIPYASFSVTVRGASHIDAGTVCEDSSAHFDSDRLHIAAVADGHGDSTCFRSEIGSKIAAELAVEQLKTFAETFPEEAIDDLFQAKAFKAITHQLAFSLIGTWRERVLAHYDANPPAEEEFSGRYEARYRRGEALEHIYGTTLIACLLTENYLLVLHQGDGRCVVIRQSGRIDQPVPWDSRCEGRYTSSMCDDDAIEACRFYVNDQRTDPIVAVYALTDGVEDSYLSMDGVSSFCGDLTARCVEHGVAAAAEQLAQELPDFSRRGSLDDVSVAAILSTAAAAPHMESFRLRTDLTIGENRVYQAQERLDSMFVTRRNLMCALEDARAKYDGLEQEVASIGQFIRELADRIRTYHTQKQEKTSSAREAKHALDAAQKAFDEYNVEYQRLESEKLEGEAQQRAAEEALRRLGLTDFGDQNG